MTTGRERRLWRIDLNDVRVRDEDGNSVEVVESVGALDGELSVTVRLCSAGGHVAAARDQEWPSP